MWWSDELYRIYGLDRREAIGYETFLARVHPGRPFAWSTPSCGRPWTTGEPFAFDHRIVHDDGSVRLLYGAGRVIRDSSLRPIRMVGIGHDITERKEAEEARAQLIHEQARRQEAEESSRAKDQFLAILSHELRTPLNAALGWAHMLREMPRDAPATRHAVDTIYRNLLVQSGLVSDIVDISRITKGALTLESAPVDLAASDQRGDGHGARVRRTRAASRSSPRSTATSWSSSATPSGCSRCSGICCRTACGSGGRAAWCSVKAESEGTSVRITVEDDGPGIDPAFLPHVFEPFRQADGSPRRAHDGLGLGLAIARHLVELHGGSMSAANRPRGGAQFTVVLPAKSVVITAP